jgi:hypothetical protein
MKTAGNITYYDDVTQGSDEWLALRCGILTASEIKLILTPTLKIASNDKERAHLFELLAQRVTKYVEPRYVSDDMLRGKEDEIDAKIIYNEKYAPVNEVGFITNNKWGFTLGFSPDGLIGEDGIVEVKSRCQKYQIETIINGNMPNDYMLQVQAGLLVSERSWCDFISYSGGLPMATIRVEPDPVYQDAIIQAAANFERKLSEKMCIYQENLKSMPRLIPTERKIEKEITL